MSMDRAFYMTEYVFDQTVTEQIADRGKYFEKSLWPLVYILRDEKEKQAYIGETTDAMERMKAHLKNEHKMHLSEALLISSERFNKSATLDIESGLIRYMAADGKYSLINGNIGIANHHYFQKKELYKNIFEDIWTELHRRSIVQKTLQEIDNSDLFKYSPYKALSMDQVQSLKEILLALSDPSKKTVMVSGGAGTGKSVLAIFLFKLLNTDLDKFKFVELGADEKQIVELVEKVKGRFPTLKMGLVIPMSSFRKTVSKVCSQIKGLKGAMVIGPSEVTKAGFDILLVDESHRLRQRKVLGSYFKAFDEGCKRLGLDPAHSTELDWVLKQAQASIFFYDRGQSIKPADVTPDAFRKVALAPSNVQLQLKTQLRSKGGQTLERFIKGLLQQEGGAGAKLEKIKVKGYELMLFDHLSDLRQQLSAREQTDGLSRLVAGYAWPWASKNDPSKIDIEIEDCQLKWNSEAVDWINSQGAIDEVGCIHTVQGYDLNYVGVIFGPEITYDASVGRIVINKEAYHDKNGKNGIKDTSQLHDYIIHIYSTLLLRGIKGAFVYAVDPGLRSYFAQYMERYSREQNENVAQLLPLVALRMQDGMLKESSRRTAQLPSTMLPTDIMDQAQKDRLFIGELNLGGADNTQVLMRVVYEAPTKDIEEAIPASKSSHQEVVSKLSETNILDERSWQKQWQGLVGENLLSYQYLVVQFKDQNGAYKTVVAKYEGKV